MELRGDTTVKNKPTSTVPVLLTFNHDNVTSTCDFLTFDTAGDCSVRHPYEPCTRANVGGSVTPVFATIPGGDEGCCWSCNTDWSEIDESRAEHFQAPQSWSNLRVPDQNNNANRPVPTQQEEAVIEVGIGVCHEVIPPTVSPVLTPPLPSLVLLQQIVDTTSANLSDSLANDEQTASREFTDVSHDSVPAVCSHTLITNDGFSTHAYKLASGSPKENYSEELTKKVGSGVQKMPCIHEEAGVLMNTSPLASANLREENGDWSRVVTSVEPTVSAKSDEVDTSGDMIGTSSVIRSAKGVHKTEAISKKSYFLRREMDVLSEIISSPSADDEPFENSAAHHLVGKSVKRKLCRKSFSESERTNSPPRKKRVSRHTPPPINRVASPDELFTSRLNATSTTIASTQSNNLIPLRKIRPSVSEPSTSVRNAPHDPSVITSKSVRVTDSLSSSSLSSSSSSSLNSDNSHLTIPSPQTIYPYHVVSANSSIADLPIRPVPISRSFRPYLSTTQPQYHLPISTTVHFPSVRPMLPVPLPPLTPTFAGAPLTFIHAGIPILPAGGPAPNFSQGSLPTFPVPIFVRPHPYSTLPNQHHHFQQFQQVIPNADALSSLRHRYIVPVAPPIANIRQHPSSQRQSSSGSQPAEDLSEDTPESLKDRRKQANARERDRVNHLNSGFEHLREALPWLHHGRRVSKVDTLRAAIDYINHLQTILWEADAAMYGGMPTLVPTMPTTDLCKFVHPTHYSRMGMLPTSFKFADSATRTAVDSVTYRGPRTAVDSVTYRGLELSGQPTTKFGFPAPPALDTPNPVAYSEPSYGMPWLNSNLHGGLRVPFGNNRLSYTVGHACAEVTEQVGDVIVNAKVP